MVLAGSCLRAIRHHSSHNPGNRPALPLRIPGSLPSSPAPNPPTTPEPSKPASVTTAKASSSDSKSSEEKSGLSSKIIIGIGVTALGLFALIAGIIVAMNSGGSGSEKLKRRGRRFD